MVSHLVHQVTFWVGLAASVYKAFSYLPLWVKFMIGNIICLHVYTNWRPLSEQGLMIANKLLEFLEVQGPTILACIRTALTGLGKSLQWLAPAASAASVEGKPL